MPLLEDLRNCYCFQASQISATSSFSFDWVNSMDRAVVNLRGLAQEGYIWVDKAHNRDWAHVIKCRECNIKSPNYSMFTDLKHCSCSDISVYSLVIETTFKIVDSKYDLAHEHNTYAFLGEEVEKQMAYELGRTKSSKKTFFFTNKKKRQDMFDYFGQSSAKALALKAENDLTARWIPYYEKISCLCADDLYREVKKNEPNVCIPFVYSVVLGKHRRKDRTRYFVFEKPDERLKIAHEHAKKMFSAQSKGKSKKEFLAELLARIKRMNALWPERMPAWAPYLETCIMLEFEVGIKF